MMATISLIVEGIKVLSLTLANTSLLQANTLKGWFIEDYIQGAFKRQNRSTIKEGKLLKAVISYGKHRSKGVTLFFVYLFSAFLSVSASYGYIAESVYLTTQGKEVLSSADTQEIYKDQLSAMQEAIDQARKMNMEYSMAQDKLDVNNAQYQAKYVQYQAKIDKNNADIQKKLLDKETKNEQIQQLRLSEIKTNQSFGKTMYQLMGESLGISDKTVMFVLLYLLAIMIEIGLFVTSPHFRNMDKEDLEGEPVHQEAVIPKEEPSRTKPRKEPRKESVPVTLPESSVPVPVPVKDIISPEVARSLEPTPEPVTLIYPVAPPEEPKNVVINVSDPQPVKKIFDKIKLIDAFVDNLFDATGKMREKEEVAEEVGLPLVHAIKIVDYLTKQKNAMTYRPNMGWYKNITMPLSTIKKYVGMLYGNKE
jgi:hypothetical protein